MLSRPVLTRPLGDLPGVPRPAAFRRYAASLPDALVYIVTVGLCSLLLADGTADGRLALGRLAQSQASGLLVFVAVLRLFGTDHQPDAPTVRGEVVRTTVTVTLATLCAFAATLLVARDVRLAVPVLTALPPVLLVRCLTHVRLARRASAPVPAVAVTPLMSGTAAMPAADLATLMQALAQQLVARSGVQGCRIFTHSSDGAALVLRGAACREDHAGGRAAPEHAPRLRILLSDIPWLEPVLACTDWLHLQPTSAAAELGAAIARLLGGATAQGEVSLTALRATDGPVGVVCVVGAPSDAAAARDRKLRAVAAELAEQQEATERALRLPALGYAGDERWWMLNDMPCGVVVLNTTTRILAVNPPAEAALGRPAAALVGSRLCGGPSDCPCPIHAAVRAGGAVETACEAVFGPPGAGGTPMRATLRPLRRPDGEHELVMAALSPAAATTQTTAAPPVGAEVAAMVSHELHTPLATLRAASELALEEDIDPEHRRDLLTRISRQVTRLDQLIQELGDVFRLQAGRLQLRRELLDLPALCEEVIGDVQQHRAGHQIRLVQEAAVPPVLADRLKLRTVLSNLIGNAVKYAPLDTTITVTLQAAADEVRLSVQDQGSGITAEHLPRVFDQFYRAPSGEHGPQGYGLGLYIVRMLVELHGGRIWAESEPGRGSCFRFSLPLLREQDTAAPHRNLPLDSASPARHDGVQEILGI